MERRSESQQSQSNYNNAHSTSDRTIMQCPTLEVIGQTQSGEKSRGQQRVGQQQYRFVQRCSNRSLNFLQVISLFVYGSVLIASLQAAVFPSRTSEKASILSASTTLFTGAAAMAVDRIESPRALGSDASSQALFATVVRSADAGSNERRMEEQSAAESRRDGIPSSFLRGQRQQPLNRAAKPSSDIASVPVQRWGHSVTYLEDANVAFFIGGVVPSGQNESALTSAVYALDLSVNTTQEWTRLPSTNLAAHAFAARAVAYNSNGTVERIIVIGGSSSNCSANATQAFTWQIGNSWKDGNWSAVKMDYPELVPSRRRGMEAVQVPVQVGQSGLEAKQLVKEGGISYMLLGGIADESTCSNSSTLYPDVDIWTMAASLKGASKVIQANSTKRMDTRTLILSSNMTNVSLADYSSVVIPGNGTQSDRVLMLGGVNEEGELASLERPWIYNISSGLWSKLDTTNSTGKKSDIPSGRVGHTATLTSNGTVIVYGGFTSLDSKRQPKSDVHVLDLSVEPAVWSKVNTSGSPSRAFHTAFMTGDFLVVGFGMGGNATSYANSTNATVDMSRILPTKRAANDTTYQPVQVMDTANKQGWTWSNSIREALAIRPTTASKAARVAAKATANRAAVVSATSTSAATITAPLFPTVSAASSARSQSTARATSKVTVSSASRASAQRVATRSSASASSSTASSSSSSTFTNPFTSSQPSATATSTGSSGSGMTQSTCNTAVIASILGAAALAASIGGLYAAHKRREASRRDNDDNLYGNDRYGRFSDAAPGPPVSSLWLNQPATWAGNASKGLKDKATLASVALLNRGKDSTPKEHGSPAMGETYTSPFPVLSTRAANYDMLSDVQGLRNLPASSRLSIRRNQLREQEAIRNKLRQQEKRASMGYFSNEMSPYHGSNGGDAYDEEQAQRTDRRRTVGAEAFHNFLRSPAVPQPAVTRNGSSESLGSVGGASHFSYPYLSAMNRPTIHFGGAAGEDYSNNSSPYSMHQAQMGPPPASPSYILDSQANKASLLNDHHQAGFPFRSLIDGHGSDSGSRGPSVDSTNGAIASHHEEALAAVAARRESRRPSTMMMMQATQISLPSSNEDDSPTLPSADYLSPASSSLQHQQQQQSDRRSSRHSTLRVVNSDGH